MDYSTFRTTGYVAGRECTLRKRLNRNYRREVARPHNTAVQILKGPLSWKYATISTIVSKRVHESGGGSGELIVKSSITSKVVGQFSAKEDQHERWQWECSIGADQDGDLARQGRVARG